MDIGVEPVKKKRGRKSKAQLEQEAREREQQLQQQQQQQQEQEQQQQQQAEAAEAPAVKRRGRKSKAQLEQEARERAQAAQAEAEPGEAPEVLELEQDVQAPVPAAFPKRRGRKSKAQLEQERIAREQLQKQAMVYIPHDIIFRRILGRLCLPDLLRLCLVNKGWNRAIRSPSFPPLGYLRRDDLPMFYCSTSSYNKTAITTIVYDTKLDKWHWIPIPNFEKIPQDLRGGRGSTKLFNENCKSLFFPACGVGSLVCWMSYSSNCIYIHKTFTPFYHKYSRPWKNDTIAPTDAKFLCMERRSFNTILFQIIFDQDQYSIKIERLNYSNGRFERHAETGFLGLNGGLAWPTAMRYAGGRLTYLTRCEWGVALATYEEDGMGWAHFQLPEPLQASVCLAHVLTELCGDTLLLTLVADHDVRRLHGWLFVAGEWINALPQGLPYVVVDWDTQSIRAACRGSHVLVVLVKPPQNKVCLLDLAGQRVGFAPPCIHPTTHENVVVHQACPLDATLNDSLL